MRGVVRAARSEQALAQAADLLSGELRRHLSRLAVEIKCGMDELEQAFLAGLRRQGLNPQQCRALAAITAGAAARVLGRRKTLGAFLEHVEYNGRRLAKMDVPVGAVLEALRQYDSLLARCLGGLDREKQANLRWAREQLSFGTVLTLNNAFYQVREAETRAFYDLFQAELESRDEGELLGRFAGVLASFCQAEGGRIFLGADLPAELDRARHIERGGAEHLLLDASWRGRYRCCWSIPLVSCGRLAGAMQFGFSKPYEWLPRELRLLAAAGERCLLASEKSRLTARLAEREEQVLRLAAHMMQVEEGERRRISRELHDDSGQALLCLRLQLEMLERAAPEDCPELRSGLASARESVERTIVETRRLIADLSPAVLEQLGLAAALRQLASRVRRLHGIGVRLHVPRLETLSPRTAIVVYRLVQECCNNVVKHAAAAHLNIYVAAADSRVRLHVEDDGAGFDPEQALAKRDSMGLTGMRERVALLEGEFRIRSRPGQGTRIDILLPAPTELERAVPQSMELKGSYAEDSRSACRRSHTVPAGNQEPHRNRA